MSTMTTTLNMFQSQSQFAGHTFARWQQKIDERIAPGVAHDPGWNDPPKLSFGAMGQTKFIKKGLLNKRVAFPLNSNSPVTPSSSSLQATPPKGDFCLPLSSGDSPVHSTTFINPFGLNPLTNDASTLKSHVPQPSLCSSIPDSESKEDEDKSPLSSLEEIIDIFQNVISELMTPDDSDRIGVDIQRRLHVMSTMWMEGHLNDDVQLKMIQLAEALKKGQGTVANDLHIEMIVDHTSQVSAWMPAVRKLVHCCMLKAERANKVEDNKGDLATEKNDKPHTQGDVEETSA